MTLKHVNAIIVGAGAGGGVVAKELSEAGLSVVLLERGKWIHQKEFYDDEFLHNKSIQMGPDERHLRVIRKVDNWITVSPMTSGSCHNAACVGGGTVFYGALAWRFLPDDFRMKSVYGHVEGSSIEDWPISYEELEPFYEKVEWEIGVSGDNSSNPYSGKQKKPYPMPAFPYSTGGQMIADAGKKIGLHPFPVPMFRNSVPYGGKPACQLRTKCWGFSCPYNARNGTHNTVIPKAIATGNCELRTGCMTSEVVVNDKGKAYGVRYFDETGKAQFQTADLVVLSAGATESARLLLNSKSKLFPNGAGNNNDMVGRNLQGHKYGKVTGVFDRDIYGPGPGKTVGFMDYLHHNEGIIGGGLLDAPQNAQLPYEFASTVAGWGQGYKNQVRKTFKNWISITLTVQELPVLDSRVVIDPDVKDAWGIPVLRIMAKQHHNNYLVMKFLSEKAVEIMKGTDAIEIKTNPIQPPGEFDPAPHGQHQAGTCRMGNDPKTSVTNRYGQIHEIDNLFVADAGLHVTNAGLNPAETIMALGYWVSHYIKQEWKALRLRPQNSL